MRASTHTSPQGASRYWMDTESDLAHFLAEADQSKVCRNCKKPGHIASRCPHTVCNTCGALDEHERKDCPWSVLCFGCGQRGHRKQVSRADIHGRPYKY
jgi:protein AIR1/2